MCRTTQYRHTRRCEMYTRTAKDKLMRKTSLMSPFSLGAINPTSSSIALFKFNLCSKSWCNGIWAVFSFSFSTSSSEDPTLEDPTSVSCRDAFREAAFTSKALFFFVIRPCEPLCASAETRNNLLGGDDLMGMMYGPRHDVNASHPNRIVKVPGAVPKLAILIQTHSTQTILRTRSNTHTHQTNPACLSKTHLTEANPLRSNCGLHRPLHSTSQSIRQISLSNSIPAPKRNKYNITKQWPKNGN